MLAPVAGSAAAILARTLVAELGSLHAVLWAPSHSLHRLTTPEAAQLLGDVRESIEHILRTRIGYGPVLGSFAELRAYLHATMGGLRVEQVRALFLDAAHQLLRDEIVSQGAPTRAPLYVRNLLKRALDLEASGLILVHNHPGGGTQPSAADKAYTREIAMVAPALELTLHDHIIVTSAGITSLRSLGLL